MAAQPNVIFARDGFNPRIPERKHMSAGFDLFADGKSAAEKYWEIKPGEQTIIKTGIYCQLPPDLCGLIMSRSGLSRTLRLHVSAGLYLLDPDYRGEISVPMRNDGTEIAKIKEGERFAQILFQRFPLSLAVSESARDELEPTARGEGGFGSTGQF